MEPTNDHERKIARLVDDKARQSKLNHLVIRDVASSVSFLMSRSDSKFLVAYVQWRRDHPLKPHPREPGI